MTIRDMLFTPSSSDSLPLIAAAPLSSSCGMNDRLIIQRPPCEAASFSWSNFSDFSIIEKDSFLPTMNAYQSESSSSSADTYMEDASSTSSQDTITSLSENLSSSSSESSSNQKRVKFYPFLEVRTHSITLGDHPCCTLLPVQLDWEHAETENVNLELHERKKACHGKARKLSYIERKHLLKQFVDAERLQTTLSHQPLLRKAGNSSRQLTAMAWSTWTYHYTIQGLYPTVYIKALNKTTTNINQIEDTIVITNYKYSSSTLRCSLCNIRH